MSILDFSAEAILKARAVDLFTKEETAAALRSELLKKWHPDRNKDSKAGAVVAHINSLFDTARAAFSRGGYPDTLTIKTSKGDQHYTYLAVVPFELGEIYICSKHIVYATERQYDDLAKRALDVSKEFKFPHKDVEDKLRPALPRNIHTVANGTRAYTIMARDRDYVRLKDLLDAKGPLDPKHVAWILSRAYNLCGWLSYSKIVHLDISPETFFVEPSSHLAGLLGGWFYSSAPKNEKLKKRLAAPARSLHLAKGDAVKAHLAQIRVMGRRALGCNSISQLRARTDVPAAMKSWLMSAAGDHAVKEEDAWKDVLLASFGERKFTVLHTTTKDVYK